MDAAVKGETPSGKGAADENFPVGSWLIPRALRPHVASYYAFARAIDDIADNPDLAADDKVMRLEGFAAALNGQNSDPVYAKAHALRRTLDATGISARHGLDLISAFKQDAVKPRYETWDELIDYCLRSAAPVGRFLCDLHGEDTALYPLSDALCNALQVINHLQDCAKDYAAMDRVYLPQEWMRAEGATVEDLKNTSATGGLRRVLDRCVTGTEALLADARKLPRAMNHRSLAAETAVIVSIADTLTARLSRQDPLAMRVALGPVGAASAAARGLLRLWYA
ncbi:MAG: squalene synthase HpnC [Rhodospirillaceae bacterium]|nr:squalene synthase HpnC [Rhodospirillaceae bacterium]